MLILPGALLPLLSINNSPEIYLSKDEPSVQLQDRMATMFPEHQVVALLFEPPDVFAADFLQALETLAQKLKTYPEIDRVHRITDFEHIARTADGFAVQRLLDMDAGRVDRATVLADPFAPGFLIGREGEATAIIIRPHQHMPDSVARMQLLERIRADVAASPLQPYLTGVAGQVTLDVEQLRSMLSDNMVFVPATVGLGLLLIWWLFRRVLAVVLVGLVMSAAAQAALVTLIIAGQPFTLVAAILPPFMSAISLAFMVHLLNQFQQPGMQKLAPEARVREAVKHVWRPSFYAALTTAVGLGSLAVSPIRPVAWFGIAGAVGAIVLFVLVNIIVPPLLLRFDNRGWGREPLNTRLIGLVVMRVAKFAMRRALLVFAGFLVLTAVSLPTLQKIYTETDIYRFFADDHPINVDTHRFESKLSGAMPLDAVFTVPQRDGLLDPAVQKWIAEFQQFADAQPEVTYSISMPDLLREMHWAFQPEEAAEKVLPDSRDLITQYLFVYDGKDLFDLVDREYQTTRVSLALNAHSTRAIKDVRARLETWLAAHPHPQVRAEIGSEARIFTDQEDLLVSGQINGLWLSFLMILAFFWLQWRNVPLSLFALLPNAAPIFFVFVVMALSGIALDMATALIAGVAVGVAVDDTIHLVESYAGLMKRGRSHAYALLHTLRASGKACALNMLIISSQFALLLSSDFVPTNHFGFMTALGLFTAALFELLLLPALFTLCARGRWWRALIDRSRTGGH